MKYNFCYYFRSSMTKTSFDYAQWIIAFTVMFLFIFIGLVLLKRIYENGLPKKWMNTISSAVMQDNNSI